MVRFEGPIAHIDFKNVKDSRSEILSYINFKSRIHLENTVRLQLGPFGLQRKFSKVLTTKDMVAAMVQSDKHRYSSVLGKQQQ